MTATTREALVAQLAEELTTARLEREPVAPLTERHPDLTVEDACAVGECYNVPAHELLQVAGQRKLVGGQEDLLVDIAVALSAAGMIGR